MTTITRRHFVQYGLGAGAALALPWSLRPALASAGHKLTPYLEPLPLPGAGIMVATPAGPSQHRWLRDAVSSRHCGAPHRRSPICICCLGSMHPCGGSSVEKKSLPTHEDADVFLGMVKLQPRDISIVAKTGTFLLWYDMFYKRYLTVPISTS